MSNLIIQGKDALKQYGVRMGKGFLAELDTPADFKSFVSNESRTEDGTRYVVVDDDTHIAERDVTLPFVLIGQTAEDARTKRDAFLAALKGWVTISVPSVSADVYKLIVLGFSSYARNVQRTIYSIKVKFKEPNPADRS